MGRPVNDDDEIVRLFRAALAQTRMETRSLKLCYCGERDGWNADRFHEKVDRQEHAFYFAVQKMEEFLVVITQRMG